MANRRVRRLAVRRRQHGQALIYGLFMLFAGLAGLYFMFNTGQVVRAKTKLVTTADAAAYSGGLMHARALNYHAYINRALMADEVLIAQMVSIASWGSYVESWSKNLPAVHFECKALAESIESGNFWGVIGSFIAALRKFDEKYAFACGTMELTWVKDLVENYAGTIPQFAGGVVEVSDDHKNIIMAAPSALYAVFEGERHKVMQKVADANYKSDGKVIVDGVTSIDDWANGPEGSFVTKYSDDERVRFREVAVNAAHSDPFVRERRWTSEAVYPDLPCIPNWRLNEVRRRGGTEMLGLDEWHAVDTQSFHKRKKRKWGIGCKGLEERDPTGYAQQEAYDSSPQTGYGNYGGSPSDNAGAHARAVGGFGIGSGAGGSGDKIDYSGLPSYYELNANWFNGANKNKDPILRHAVRLTRAKAHLHTTDADGGQIRTRSDSRIAAYDTTPADDVMAAVSGTETFFERPPGFERNVWGDKSNKPVELGSLFNPYWHTRLVEGDVAEQWLQQGVARP